VSRHRLTQGTMTLKWWNTHTGRLLGRTQVSERIVDGVGVVKCEQTGGISVVDSAKRSGVCRWQLDDGFGLDTRWDPFGRDYDRVAPLGEFAVVAVDGRDVTVTAAERVRQRRTEKVRPDQHEDSRAGLRHTRRTVAAGQFAHITRIGESVD